MGHQMSQARRKGYTVFEVMVYMSLYAVDARRWCREHRLRGNGVWVTICRRCGETV